jgi:hypothetical protein
MEDNVRINTGNNNIIKSNTIILIIVLCSHYKNIVLEFLYCLLYI